MRSQAASISFLLLIYFNECVRVWTFYRPTRKYKLGKGRHCSFSIGDQIWTSPCRLISLGSSQLFQTSIISPWEAKSPPTPGIIHLRSWILDHGSWVMDLWSWILDHGSWVMDLWSWILALGSSIVYRPSSRFHRPSSIVHRPSSHIHLPFSLCQLPTCIFHFIYANFPHPSSTFFCPRAVFHLPPQSSRVHLSSSTSIFERPCSIFLWNCASPDEALCVWAHEDGVPRYRTPQAWWLTVGRQVISSLGILVRVSQAEDSRRPKNPCPFFFRPFPTRPG